MGSLIQEKTENKDFHEENGSISSEQKTLDEIIEAYSSTEKTESS